MISAQLLVSCKTCSVSPGVYHLQRTIEFSSCKGFCRAWPQSGDTRGQTEWRNSSVPSLSPGAYIFMGNHCGTFQPHSIQGAAALYCPTLYCCNFWMRGYSAWEYIFSVSSSFTPSHVSTDSILKCSFPLAQNYNNFYCFYFLHAN